MHCILDVFTWLEKNMSNLDKIYRQHIKTNARFTQHVRLHREIPLTSFYDDLFLLYTKMILNIVILPFSHHSQTLLFIHVMIMTL